jgi:lipoic acid synthetase
MVGLGESPAEVCAVLDDLNACGCRVVTIGQYLQPSAGQYPVCEYIAPGRFEEYSRYGERIGIGRVVAGPFVRSSYHAAEIYENLDA